LNGSILEAIGRVTVHFAHLDEEVSRFIWSLIAGYDVLANSLNSEQARNSLRSQKLGQAVTARLGFRRKLEILEALAFERLSGEPQLLRDIRDIRKELDSSSDERNRLIHSVMGTLQLADGASVPGVAVALKATHDDTLGMAQAVSVHSQEQLAHMADSLARLRYRLHELRQRCFSSGQP
jgi:hypothetical protein